MPTSESDSSCQHVGRKKRRGMIEKRRRDRINNSLNELRRLVPAAFEKQGSAKLEKAEILQMTVDHLTMLHAKGFDAFSFDPHKFATDYHGIGFRECASECARYLVAVEGMDLQDPFRLRLMSHLQCYATQRELALKTSAHASAWNPSAFTTPTHQFATPAIPPQLPGAHSGSSTDPSWCHSTTATSSASSMINEHGHHHHQLSMSSHVMPPPPTLFDQSAIKRNSGSPPPHVSSTVPTLQSTAGYSHHPAAGHMSTATAHQYFSAPGYTVSHTATGPGQSSSSSVKHYRPWGAELAY